MHGHVPLIFYKENNVEQMTHLLKQLFCNIEDLLVNEHDVFIVIHCSQSPFLSLLVLPEDSLHHGAAGVAQSVLS